jgi:hypothetical protein
MSLLEGQPKAELLAGTEAASGSPWCGASGCGRRLAEVSMCIGASQKSTEVANTTAQALSLRRSRGMPNAQAIRILGGLINLIIRVGFTDPARWLAVVMYDK